MVSAQRLEAEFKPTKSSYVPPQAKTAPPVCASEFEVNGPRSVAKALLPLIQAIQPDSIIHENGCNSGIVTRLLLESKDGAARSSPQTIYATDIEAMKSQVDELAAFAKQAGSPVHAAIMPPQALTFAGEIFTHSIVNLVLYRLPEEEAVTAVQQSYRTLKPGGTAVFTCWGKVPHRTALTAAHEATREPHRGALIAGARRWEDGALLRKCVTGGGFSPDQMQLHQTSATLEIPDLDAWNRHIWGTLGRPADGWEAEDAKSWEKAVRVFDETLRSQKGVDLKHGGKAARLTFPAWILVATK